MQSRGTKLHVRLLKPYRFWLFSAACAGPQSARVLRLYDRSAVIPLLYCACFASIKADLLPLSPSDLGTRLISVGSGGFQTRPFLQDKTSRRGFCRLSTGGVPASCMSFSCWCANDTAIVLGRSLM